MHDAVESAIECIWQGYSEPLSLADIAKSAILSRFHFSRVFRDATGVSPGRFLSAVRIYQAKHMLVSTPLSVTDISLAVGYNSLGSFTNRFTESVGTSPTRFRRMWLEGSNQACAPALGSSSHHTGAVTGTAALPSGWAAAHVFIGAFETPIIQRRPVSSAIVETCSTRAASYRLDNVPPGEWFIRAVAAADSVDPEPWTRRCLLVGGQGSVKLTAGALLTVDLTLRARRSTDLPILFAVPGLDRQEIRCECCPAAGPAAGTRLTPAFASRTPGDRVA
ncbi:MAG TPA: helix-turn-helix transcriptional regulator [Streptosporangiaceae bacterium]|nr:helix-turn-helix transcriptional regulator [Streptosporangiaceae bacterium]